MIPGAFVMINGVLAAAPLRRATNYQPVRVKCCTEVCRYLITDLKVNGGY
jgi:hypothetical protein